MRQQTSTVLPGGAAAWLGQWAWLVYASAMLPVGLVYLFAPHPINSGPVFNLIGTSSIVAILIGIRRNRPALRLPWYLFALGQAFFVAGDVLAYNYQRFFHAELPFPSVADAFYLAVYPTLVFGILLLIRRRTPGRDAAGLIDSLVISIGLGLVSWVFLMEPYARDSTLSLSTKLTSIAYPLMDVLLLAVAVRLSVGAGRRGTGFTLMVSSVVALFVTDSTYGWLLLHGGYETGGLLDGGWIAFYVLWGAAALHPSMRQLSETAPHEEVKPSGWRLVFLGAATLMAPIVQGVEFARGKPEVLSAVSAATLFTLVVARMAGLVRKHEQTEARFSSLVQNSSDVVTVVGADLTIRYVSPSVEGVLGYRPDELLNTRFAELVHEDDRAKALGVMSEALVGGETRPELTEFRIRHRLGDWVHAETLRTNLLGDPSVGGIVLNTRDVSERWAFEQRLARLAFHDSVTNLANRPLFTERVEHAVAGRRLGDLPVAVLVLDLDDFKTVNDSLGHVAGDELLREVGSRVANCIRASDTAARLGGDEFAFLLNDADETSVIEAADRILKALERPFVVEAQEVFIRASLGIAFGPADRGDAEGTEALLRNADIAMYTAKAEGKGRWRLFEPQMHVTALERLALKADLQRAVKKDEFTLHYQPIFNLGSGSIAGFEALLRWQHPEHGTVMPGGFVPLAEETGLIVPIGSWVLMQACRDARRLQDAYPLDPPLTVSVNISARQLQRDQLVTEVRNALEAASLDPATLVLEITETSMMKDAELSILRMHELCELGVRLAVDDFGAGYSSLNSIRRFPVDIVKIDKSFVDDLGHDGEVAVVTSAIVELAKKLDLRPVAEGIENDEQLSRLLELGCELGQGYRLARPVELDTLEEMIASQHRSLAA